MPQLMTEYEYLSDPGFGQIRHKVQHHARIEWRMIVGVQTD